MTEYIRIVPVNYADTATLTATSSATRFPITNLQSNIRDRVWRSTDQATQTLDGNLPVIAPLTVSAWGLWPGSLGMRLSYLRMNIFEGTDLTYDSGLHQFTQTMAVDWLGGSNAWGSHSYSSTPGNELGNLVGSFNVFVTEGGQVS